MNSGMAERRGRVERKTAETDIVLDVLIDGQGAGAIGTGIAFFDHMLKLFARHSLVDLNVKARGDLDVDLHHTVEDVGICLGQAFNQALGEKEGIRRYGSFYLPMDETLARVVVDFSGRPFFHFEAPSPVESIGLFSFQLVEEFLRAFSVHAAINLHVEVLYGRDAHHMAEAIFKGFARAVDQACQIDSRVHGVPSTKGSL